MPKKMKPGLVADGSEPRGTPRGSAPRKQKRHGRHRTVSMYVEEYVNGWVPSNDSELDSTGTGLGPEEMEEAGAVVDVMANLTCLSRAKGELRGRQPAQASISSPPPNPVQTSGLVPEKSKFLGRKLGYSVKKGQLSESRALAAARWVDKEIRKLIEAIVEIGTPGKANTVTVTFKELFEHADDLFEALPGLLKTAKKHKVVKYWGSSLLVQGKSDTVAITLLRREVPDASANTYTYRQVRDTSRRPGAATRTAVPKQTSPAAAAAAPTSSRLSLMFDHDSNGTETDDAVPHLRHNPRVDTIDEGPEPAEVATTTIAFSGGAKLLVPARAASPGGAPPGVSERHDAASAASDTRAMFRFRFNKQAGLEASSSDDVAFDTSSSPEPAGPELPSAAGLVAAAKSIASLTAEPRADCSSDAAAAGERLKVALDMPEESAMLKRKLRQSVRTGTLDESVALSTVRFVDSEIRKLIAALETHGKKNSADRYEVAYGALCDVVTDDFESLSGTLRTAKKHGVVAYSVPMLMRMAHENILIELLKTEIPDADLDTYTFKQVRHVSCRQMIPPARATPRSEAAKTLLSELAKTGSSAESAAKLPLPGEPTTAPLDQPAGAAGPRRVSFVEVDEELAVVDVMASLVVLAEEQGHGDEAAGVTADSPASPPSVAVGANAPEKGKAPAKSAVLSDFAVQTESTSTGKAMTETANGQDVSSRISPSGTTNAVADASPTTDVHDEDAEDDDDDDGGDGGGDDDEQDLGDPSLSPMDAALKVPEQAPILARTLGASVRRGDLSKNRAMQAARWVDKEIRKLIALIMKHGNENGGQYSIEFGTLFVVAEAVMEAVAGTLKTAKKHKVVAYDAEVLFQGMSDAVVIKLLKHEIPDSSADTYTYRAVRQCSIRGQGRGAGTKKKTSGFGQATLQASNSKCAICKKTVYAMEFVGASGKAFHRSCFRCKVCKGVLRNDNYATVNNEFYCKTHYEELFKRTGGYDFGKEVTVVG